MYVTPTNRSYRSELARHGIAARTILTAPTKAHIQQAARAWTTQLDPQRTSMRLNICDASSHTVLKQYRFRPLKGGATALGNHRAVFQGVAETVNEIYFQNIALVDVTEDANGLVRIQYTINGAGPFDMLQGKDDIVENNTIRAELEQQLNQHVCAGIENAEPQLLDRADTEQTTRVRCSPQDVALLDADKPIRHVAVDPLDPVQREEA